MAGDGFVYLVGDNDGLIRRVKLRFALGMKTEQSAEDLFVGI